jgi:hypothetical protein
MGGNARRRERKLRVRAMSPRPTLVDFIWFTATCLAADDPDWAPAISDAIDRFPDGFAPAVSAELELHRERMLDRGWTEEALSDVAHNLLWARPGTERVEHDLRLLALLGTLVPPFEGL